MTKRVSSRVPAGGNYDKGGLIVAAVQRKVFVRC